MNTRSTLARGSTAGRWPRLRAVSRTGRVDRPDDVDRPRRRTASLVAVAAVAASSASVLATSPVSASTGPRSASGNSVSDSGLHTRLTKVVEAGIPGAIVLVQDGAAQDLTKVRLATAGVSNLSTGARLRPQARFRVGSITKTFVATLVLQLVGEGRLKLDDPVERTLPGLLAQGNRITVRQLLNHTSGLFDYTGDPAVLEGIEKNHVFTPRELIATAERHPSGVTPGTVWAYSNTDYIVAGLLVEATTHHRLGQEMRQRIFTPLNLKQTSFPAVTARIRGYHAHGYVPADLVPTPNGRPFDVTGLNPSAAWAAGAIVSNAADLYRFYRALMSGKLLSPSLLGQMKTTVAEDPANPTDFRYGLGIERVQDPCGMNWGHSGGIFGYQDMAYWNEKTGRTVVIASTMFPSPAAADAPLANLTDYALCGTATTADGQ